MPESDHYAPERARHYQQHHAKNARTRLTTWRERRCLYRALRDAGSPRTALDLPCGTGRFWPAFADAGVEHLIAADGSAGMLDVAAANRLHAGFPQQLFVTSAFDVALSDRCVEFAACLRFYHHLSMPEDRRRLLAEIGRLTSRYAAVSLWVDGNLAGRRRLQKAPPQPVPGYGRRICRRRSEVEAEFAAAGFRMLRHYDVWPRLSMWRLYLLEHDGH
ncbi:MAG: class I SAM-dependent methyltransferase [Pseudomonadales bacterium]